MPENYRLTPGADEPRTVLQFPARATEGRVQLQHSAESVLFAVTAQVPVLPDPLRLLHGPLLATVETWSDGTIVARLPSVALDGRGESDSIALANLADSITEFAEAVLSELSAGRSIAGPLAAQWRALTAVVDVSGLAV